MIGLNGSARTASLLVIGLFAAGVAGVAGPALAAPVHFIGGADDTDNSWTNTANWSNGAVPGSGTDVVVDPSNQGAQIHDGDNEKVKSLQLDGGLNLVDGGKLTVSGNITNNGVNSAYFINDGVVSADTVLNTYNDNGDADPDNDYFGYISNTRKFTATLDNDGVVINGDAVSGVTDAVWLGDVSNGATGSIIDSGGTWHGNVVSNAGAIYNDLGSHWIGDVQSNDADIENTGGSVWKGNVVSNAGGIDNLDGSLWQGDVVSNDNYVNNDGGVWKGNVLSNSGTIFNTADSVWNGDITSSGELWMSGTVNGAITNNGGNLHVYEPLEGVAAFVNNGGALDMDDGQAGSSFSAASWSGSGTAFLDFAPGLGQADHVVLSGDYSADTEIDLGIVGPYGRTLGDIPLITVGGSNTGSINVLNLPDDGIISYRVVQTGASWVIATTLNDAPAHAADMVARVGDAVAVAAELPPDSADTCGRGGWVRGLGGARAAHISGTDSRVDFAGAALGYDLPCLAVGGTGAKLGFGATMGAAFGTVSDAFAGNDELAGQFGQGFVGVYGDLAAGPLHAILQGQFAVANAGFSDRQSALDAATLVTTRYDLGGKATYDLTAGALSVTPELGFAASGSRSTSGDFGDVGEMSLTAAPALDLHAGAKVSTDIALLGGSTTLSPFASIAYHDGFGGGTTFTDRIGGTAAVPVSTLGSYVALGIGADLLRIPTAAGGGIDGGLRADVKLGSAGSDAGFDGHLRVQF